MISMKEKMLAKINTGEVKMMPRWYFVLRGLLWASLGVVLFLVAIYVLSFFLFFLRETGLWFAPGFGLEGLMLFVVSSPWILVAAVGGFVLVLYLLVRSYAFSYKKPLVYSMIGIVLAVIGIASVLQSVGFHDRTRDFAETHRVPGLAPLYRSLDEKPPKDVTKGEVILVTSTALQIATREGNIVVHISDTTKMPKTAVTVGERVEVFGPNVNGFIEAFGIRKAGDPPPPPPEKDW